MPDESQKRWADFISRVMLDYLTEVEASTPYIEIEAEEVDTEPAISETWWDDGDNWLPPAED